MTKTTGIKLAVVLAVAAAFTPFVAPAAQQAEKERFDYLVREDFFAGFVGDKAAFRRGMEKCEARLKTDPDNPEVLVWHGSGLMFQATEYFQRGEFTKGIELQQRGVAEMDGAVAKRPKDVSVLVPRAAFLVTYSRFMPDPVQRRAMLEKVVADYEEVYRQQKPTFDKRTAHSRGELLFGLAEAYLRLGGDENRAKATEYLKQARGVSADYATEATAWLKAPPDAKPATFFHSCIGCHSK